MIIETDVIKMQEIYDFLKSAETYFLATLDGEQPRVRPFGTKSHYKKHIDICYLSDIIMISIR